MVNEKIKFVELEANIIKWAKDRKLDTSGTIEGQSIKTLEETSELVKAVCKNNTGQIIDGIGDIVVTLIIGNFIDEKHNTDNKTTSRVFEEVLEEVNDTKEERVDVELSDYEEIKQMISALNDNITFIFKLGYSEFVLHTFLYTLMIICEVRGIELVDCLEIAYDKIKDRQGKTIDGQFIKD